MRKSIDQPAKSSDPLAITGAATEFLNTSEAAFYLRLSSSTLAKWRLAGGIGPEFLKLGRRVIYAKASLDLWLLSRRRSSTSEADQ